MKGERNIELKFKIISGPVTRDQNHLDFSAALRNDKSAMSALKIN